MIYRFKTYTADSRVIQGTIEAESEAQAEDALYEAGYRYVLGLKPKEADFSIRKTLPSIYGTRPQEVIDFSRTLASFLRSGMSLISAIELLNQQANRPAMKEVIGGIAHDLQGGKSFSEAVKGYPSAFSESYRQIVHAGEQAGELEKSLEQVAGYMDQQLQVAAKIRRALTYPVLVLLMAIGVAILMFTIVLPPLTRLFESLGSQLPWTTRTLIAVSGFLTHYKVPIIAIIVLLFCGALMVLRTPGGRRYRDRLLLRAPLIGPIALAQAMGSFCRTSGMLLEAGLQLPHVLEVSGQISGNGIVVGALARVREKLVQGQGLSGPMSEDGLFPPMMVNMISNGESTGTIGTSLATLAAYYESQASLGIQRLISMIEPAMTVGIGLVVGFLLISIMMPLYSIMKTIH